MISHYMPYRDLAKEFGVTISEAKKVGNSGFCHIKIKSFLDRDEAYTYAATIPGSQVFCWSQQGPCSNWGYDVVREETFEERDARIRKILKLS